MILKVFYTAEVIGPFACLSLSQGCGFCPLRARKSGARKTRGPIRGRRLLRAFFRSFNRSAGYERPDYAHCSYHFYDVMKTFFSLYSLTAISIRCTK
ncbi:hypothetical protein [Aneurinibacillus tyrosinisolvens]|uniref:hypothetical protein n=1 Tax=Aneurinibacillus tyrosinisolvens TaxID=1443435 RepID=UPI00128C753F|nr:hypothetical protein [Aneurinibacillus tyrosinisolvens]